MKLLSCPLLFIFVLLVFLSIFCRINAQQSGQKQRHKSPLKTNTRDDGLDIDDDDENKDLDVDDKDGSDRQNRFPDRKHNRNNAPDRRRPSSRNDEDDLDDSKEFSPSRNGKRKHWKKHRHSKHDKYDRKRKHWKKHSACKKHGKHHRGCKHSHHHHHHRHRNRKPSYSDEDNDDDVFDNDRNNRGREKDRNRERTSTRRPDSRGRNPTFNDEDENSDRNNIDVLDT